MGQLLELCHFFLPQLAFLSISRVEWPTFGVVSILSCFAVPCSLSSKHLLTPALSAPPIHPNCCSSTVVYVDRREAESAIAQYEKMTGKGKRNVPLTP